ncbi:MAG: hypothetical protein KAT01_11550, partial [Candidatus Aminicenantes bacterium]|nr:hypothetical protein [Candidatus Aminicenantes bacterium]
MKDKKRLKKILRIFLWIFAGIILVILIFHTPPVRNIVKSLLSRTVANRVGGEIDVGRMHYNLLRGEVKLEDIMLISSGLDVQADRVEASFFSGDGISLKIEHPRVIIRPKPDAPKSKSDTPSRFWTILKKFNTVVVEEGRFELEDNSSETKWIQGSIRIERQSSADRPEEQIWSLNSELQCSFVDSSQILLKIGAILGIEQDNLHLKESWIETSHSSLEAQGVIYQSGPFKGNLAGNFQIVDTLARSFGLEPPVEGTVKGRFQLDVDGSNLNSRVELESPQLLLADSGPWEARAQASFDGRVVHVDSLMLDGYSGSLESRGSVDLKSKEVKAQIHANNLDPNSLLSLWTKIPVLIASRIGGDIQLFLKDWQADQIRAKGEIRLGSLQQAGLSLSGDVDFELEKGQLSLKSKALKVFNSQISFSGKIKPDDLTAKYNLKFPLSDLPQLSEILKKSFPKVPAEGYMNVSGEVRGNLQNISAKARVKSKNLRVKSIDINLSAELELDQSGLRIKTAEIVSGPGRMQIRGLIPIGQSSNNWDLSATLYSLNLPDFAEKLGFEMSVDGTLNIQGPAKKMAWMADLQTPFRSIEQPSRNGTLSLKARGSGNNIECEELKIGLGSGTLIAAGQYQRNTKNIKGQVSGFGFRVEEIQPFVKVL